MILYVVLGLIVFLGISVVFGAPYVPSLKKDVRALFNDFLRIGSNDVLLDLGSGDGVILRQAIKSGAKKAIGYEIHPLFWLVSVMLCAGYKNAQPKLRNGWTSHFPDDTTIVYMFMVSRDAKRVAKKVQAEANLLGRDLVFVSYGAKLPGIDPEASFEAYYKYIFKPLH